MLNAVAKLIFLFAGIVAGGVAVQLLLRGWERVADRRATQFALVLVGAVAGGAVLLAFAQAAVIQTPPPAPVAPPGSTLEAIPNAPPPVSKKAETGPTTMPGIQVVQQGYYIPSGDTLVIVGEVVNTGNLPLEDVEVIAMLYESERFVGSDKGWAVMDVVFPGERVLFEVWYADAPTGWDSYTLQAQAEPASDYALERHYPHYKIAASVELRKNKWTVFGTVTNAGSQTMRLVEVFVGLYAEDGTLLSIANDYIDLDQIGPGETSTFTTYALQSRLTEAKPVSTWEVWLDGMPVDPED